MMKISHDSETAAHGQQVFTACALIWHEFDGVKKVFLPKRADTKKFLPGVYEIPGGHVDFGEEMRAGLKREIHEELGVDIKVGDPFAVFDYTNPIKGSHSIEVIYFATLLDPIEKISLQPEDHSTASWFAKDELHRTQNAKKGADDPEFQALQKAFALLDSASPDFGV
jgi:8-oxo-dGTP diphosphatase